MNNKPRLFISYSHADTNHFEEFRKQLVVLEKNGELSTWHDKKLLAGDKIMEVIRENLENSDVICFLVSQDFLASTSAYRDEFEVALKSLEKKRIKLVPIIVRSCNWLSTPLSGLTAANENGSPPTESNSDEWWLKVALAITKTLKDWTSSQFKAVSPSGNLARGDALRISDGFLSYLDDTQIQFQHRHCEEVRLSNIYVFPDIKEITRKYESIDNIEQSSDALHLKSVSSSTLLLGDDQVGKTALLQRLMVNYYELGAVPLLVDGRVINKSDVAKLLAPIVSRQYDKADVRRYLACASEKILLIDDFDEMQLNHRSLCEFLANSQNLFDKVVICSDPSIRLNEEVYSEMSGLRQYDILPMGHLRRGDLISTWNSLGRKETIQPAELESLNDVATRHVNAIVSKSVLPPKPIYILTVLQILDSARPADYSLTSYGHCYQTVIHASLLRLNISTQQLDLYINYLSELSFFMFRRNYEWMDPEDLVAFKERYDADYVIRSHDEVLRNLKAAGILTEKSTGIVVKYKYIFYFFVAKYLSDHLEDKSVKSTIYDLCGKLHVEKYANILIFLVHHSRDSGIIDELLLNAEMVFEEQDAATLNVSETSYLAELLHDLPDLIIERRNVEEERKKHLANKDEYESGYEEDRSEEHSSELIADMHRSLRIVEIIGQILRNRQSSLTKKQIKSLLMAAFGSGLKCLGFYLSFTEDHKDDVVKYISMIIEGDSVKENKRDKVAQQIFLSLCYGFSYAVVKKLADNTGSHDLIGVATQAMAESEETPALRLIEVAMKLEFQNKLPKKEIARLHKDLEKNRIAQRMLKDIVIRHLYIHSIGYEDRQWISDKLNIPIQAQRAIQHKESRIGN